MNTILVNNTLVAQEAPAAKALQTQAASEMQSKANMTNTPVNRKSVEDSARDKQELSEAISRLNEHMKKTSTQLAFSIDDSLNQVVVVVKNQETGSVVRQIPNEAALRMAHHFEELRGFLQDNSI